MTNRKDLGDPKATGGPAADPPETPKGLWVRATVNLHGAPRGSIHYVDPTHPEVQDRLRKQFLVPLPGQDSAALLDSLHPPRHADVQKPTR